MANETVADIVREMRRGTRLPGYWRSCDVNKMLQYHADRIEAAHKREVADALDVGVFLGATKTKEDDNGNN